MTDEERQNLIDYMMHQQAQFWASMRELEEVQAKAQGQINYDDRRIDRLERIMKLIVNAGRRERRLRREVNDEFNQRFAKVTDALAALAQAQARTEESIAHTDKRLRCLDRHSQS
jgi:hypothetical protein